ncbi:unnamed protein product [Litomosoides sigmodontis]|uniref:L antigen family member 3 n=1 Tax=Litomosoides sigmodontis TaxID=42156 RepID=A0A3P6S1N9_LITSI|nr:unnamed protein product [Litomosoides sigmodontis]
MEESTKLSEYLMNDGKQLPEVVNNSAGSSDENTLESSSAGENHKAILHIDLGNEEKAQIICKTLAVDKEPLRSTAKRTYSVRGHHLVVEIVSLDAKHLQKSIDNLFDMCYLAKQTFEEVTRYRFKMSNNAADASLGRSDELEFDMFKGLKSKLEDEAKRLHATVSQYSENIAQQVRSGVNDVGGDRGEQTQRLFNSGVMKTSPNFLGDESGNDFDAQQLDEQNPNGSALMHEMPEEDLLGESRHRHSSSGSFESERSTIFLLQTSSQVIELVRFSSFSNFFSAIPGMLSSGHRLNTITSDVESESVTNSSQFQSASKEQISTVLHKLQGRAESYKDKYRRLVQMYNELVRENEKCRSVLLTTQDKALDRIAKLREKNRELTEKVQEMEAREGETGDNIKELQEFVEKCHTSIEEKEEKMRQLTEENERLQKIIKVSYDEKEISDLAVQRVTAEWKGRVDCLEGEWSKRLSDSEEAGTLAIAKVKAEMHRALEEKDAELQVARARCKSLELSGAEAQRQIDELKAAVDALENEKADMVEKLSEAKQQGVKAVRFEEEEKRLELKREMEKKRDKEKEEDERLFKEMIMKNDEQWALKFKEQEEQMQLAIEEREMQKVAAVIEHDRKNENLGVQVEQLTAEKLHLKSVLDDLKERHRQQMEELCISVEASKERHQQEINEIKNKEEEILVALKNDFEAVMKSKKELEDELEELKNSKQSAVEEAESRNEELIRELAIERQTIDHLKKQHEDEMNTVRSEILTLKENYEEVLKQNNAKEELVQKDAELGELKQKLIEFNQRLSNKEKEMEELYGSLEQKTAAIMSLESEKEVLHAELSSTRELSKIHQHLQQQLKAAQMERDEAEKKYLEMEGRVQKAAQELEVDRRILQQEKQQLIKEKLDNHQWIEAKMNKNETEEMTCKVQQEEVRRADSDIHSKGALLIDTNEELGNQIENQQAQIKKLKEEKQALIKELGQLKEKVESEPKENDVLKKEINVLGRFMECDDTCLKSDSVFPERVELKEPCVFHDKKLSSSKADSFKEKDDIIDELRNKLNMLENEKSSFMDNIETLQRNLQEIVEEKNKMMKEMDDIRDSRDNLKIKVDEMEANVREALCEKDLEVEKLKKELEDQIGEASRLRSAVAFAENELKETLSKLGDMMTKNEELGTLNEKLRVEFLQKENIVSEMQKKMKEQGMKESADLELLKKSLDEEQKRRVVVEDELVKRKRALDKMKIELKERKSNEDFLEAELNKEKKEKEEEQMIRDQFAVALKNANYSLEEAQKQLAELDFVQLQKDRFVAKLSIAKEDCESIVQHLEQENEKRIEEIKKKAEQKILRMREQCETDGKTAKAELLLQIDEMRSQISEKDFQIEEQKLNINFLEQKLLDEGQKEKIIDDLRADIQAMSDERDIGLSKCAEMKKKLNSMCIDAEETKKQIESQSQRITSLEDELKNVNTHNARLRESVQVTEQLEQERKMLLDENENFGKEVERLRLEITTLQKTTREESAKVAAKVESERNRLLRDLQKEIKQLYHDLNERTQQLDEAQSKLQELSANKTENDEIGDSGYKTGGQAARLRTTSDLIEQTDFEELCALREQVAEYQKQLENTKEAYRKELSLLGAKQSCTEKFNVIGLESITNGSTLREMNDNSVVFAQHTEAEYLRNVLYRYMNERETLGKESVTLARVIATVARFSHEQVNAVVAKEEQRNYGWVGGTMQGLISSASSLSSR